MTRNDPSTDSASGPPIHAKRPNSLVAYGALALAGLFMVFGLMVLVYIGREKNRLIGAELAELDIKPLHNVSTGLSDSDMKGHIVVLHFWGTWCGECVHEFPEFLKLQKKYRDNEAVIFASVSCGNHSPEKLDELETETAAFLAKLDGDVPVYCDPVEFSRVQISQLMSAGGFRYPTTIVLDRAGRVADIWAREIDMRKVENAILRELKKTEKPRA
jgi:thiol-disulfide isomerase/thioredoxin